MNLQTLGAQRPVERLHLGIVGRLPWPREVDVRLIVVRPQIHALTGELRSVVAEQQLRRSSHLPNRIQRSDHIFALQTLAYLNRQTLPCKHIQDRQSAKPPSIRELVGHEIQTPHLVGCGWAETFAAM